MEIGIVRQVDIDDEMQQSYLDYAMSVIVARALPDARDGLKPVHRRILHAMHAMGIRPDSDYKKSARIVGEVLGKFHPHGDMAVYDAMARMAQDFSMRYPLVEGQGNFGSIDGDPPAAMRYTEARMNPIAMEMMADIEKETVHFGDNFDGSLKEPVVLPSGLPNLLINGATGIAVGMATSTPPHNLGEVCDALIFMIENWSRMDSISLEDLMKFIKGPDFPTGGIILQEDSKGEGLTAAYATGRGKITLQARVHVEEMSRGRARIIITELPYQINKSNLIERIADMTRTGGLEGLTDLRDESDRQGMRIVLELSKAADPDKVLAELYRRTPIQTTFSVIMLALVEGEPRLLNLKQALRVFLEHRLEVTQKRAQFQLAKARDREHILAGLKIALQNLDQVIQMIRTAKDVDQARERLQRRLKLKPLQADAILNMPLRRLSSLERKRINQEYREVTAQIKSLESLLRSKKKLLAEIAKELGAIKTTYSDRRRTQIAKPIRGKRTRTVLTARDLTPEKQSWIVMDRAGMIFRTPSNRLPRLAGRAAPRLVIGASTRDTLYLFDRQGNAIASAVHTIPEGDKATDGVTVASKTPFSPDADVIAGIALPPQQTGRQAQDGYLVFGTVGGMVKKSSLKELPGPSAKTFQVIKVNPKDALGWVRLTHGEDDLCLISSAGMAIRFPESDVRPMGLVAAGVMGIRMEKNARVVALEIVQPQADLLLLSEDGRVKRSSLRQFPRQGRYGKGVLAWKSSESIRLIGAAVGRANDRAVAHLAKGAARSIRFSDVPRRTRAAGGKSLFELQKGNKATHLASVHPRPVFEPVKPGPKKSTKPRSRRTTPKTTRKTPSRKRKTTTASRRRTTKKTSK